MGSKGTGMTTTVADAATGNQAALEFWQSVVDPEGRGMPEAIAGEIASYTGEPVAVVLEKMATGTEDLKRLWLETRINPSDAESVASFYRDQFVEAYELANWHCGRTNGEPPLSYAHAALFAREKGLRRALDFGSGIGTGSLCLAAAGCEVHSADIANELLQFVGHRMELRGHSPRLIDLNTTRPRKGYYDLITCFDVLEHVPDQLAKLRELGAYLRIGGYLLVNLMDDSSHPDRPMHVSSAGRKLRLVRKTSLRPDWSACTDMGYLALVRRRSSWLINRIALLIEE